MVTTFPFPRGYAGSGPGRWVGIAFVVLLHAVVIYAFAVSLGFTSIVLPAPQTDYRNIPEPKTVEPTPQPADPKFAQVVVQIPPDNPLINVEPPASGTVTTAQRQPVQPEQLAVIPPAPAARVEPTLDRSPGSEPSYPAISRRLGEEGAVVLRVLVGADGTVRQVELEQGSGYPRLDAAAMDAARTRSHFRAGMIDGRPEEMWFTYRYRFQLNQ